MNPRQARTYQGQMASCADCTGYTPVEQLVPRADGQRVCRSCDKRAKDAAIARSQLEMFHNQDRLFN